MTRFRDVPRHEYGIFLQKAEEWLDAARAAGGAGAYSAAVSSCVHSAIRAVDAIAVMRLGRRSAGGHADAKSIIHAAFSGKDRASLMRRYAFLMGLKNPSEYGGTLMTARQAADALKSAGRILEKVHAEIAK